MESQELKPIKVLIGQLKVGDRLSRTAYYKVKSVSGGTVAVENEEGFEFQIGTTIVEKEMYSASQFGNGANYSVEKVSRTELVNLLTTAGDTIFTVTFNKQPKAEDINEAIASINKGKILATADIAKKVKAAFKGEERTLVGYLVSTETGFGRSRVIDLNVPRGEHNMREIDHRTISSIIIKGRKYEVKK